MGSRSSVDIIRIKKLILVFVGIAFLAGFVVRPLWEDEIEHLHCAYLIDSGERPYLDFFQNHPPLIHLMLSPVINLFPSGLGSVLISRCLVMMVLILSILLAGRLLDTGRRLNYLFILCAVPVYWLFYHLRPDPFMFLLVVLHLHCLKRWCETGGSITAALAGVLIGTSICFTPKAGILLCGLPILFITYSRRRKDGVAVLIYLSCACAAPLLLSAYLLSSGVFGLFIESVFKINTQSLLGTSEYSKLTSLAWNIPLIVFWIWGLILRWRKKGFQALSQFEILLEYYAVLAFLGFFAAPFGWQYNLSLWVLFLALLGKRTWDVIVSGLHGYAVPAVQLLLIICLIAPVLVTMAGDWAAVHDSAWRLGQFRYISSHTTRGQSVVAIAPLHPIFTRDAASVYHPWQLYFAQKNWQVRSRWFSGWVETIIQHPPDIIDAGSLASIIFLTPDHEHVREQINGMLLQNSYLEYQYNGRIFYTKNPLTSE
jgi:Dolichyl-phosphate-mannose-protein mannosyltransferase